MYDFIQISRINDFLFCPHSLYFHSVYENFDKFQYKARPQIAGKIIHKSVDEKTFSTQKNILQSVEVFSEKYGIIGKIDIFDLAKKELVERKKQIKKIQTGYLFQLFAQKLCLEEMGYSVKKMKLYSVDDNKSYSVKLTEKEIKIFFDTLRSINNFNLLSKKTTNLEKCRNCIYHELCRKNI